MFRTSRPFGYAQGSAFRRLARAGVQWMISNDDKTAATIKALTDTNTTIQYAAEVKWASDLSIYMHLLEDDTLRTSDSIITAFYDSAYVANMGKLVRAATGLSGQKDRSKYRDTLNAITTSITPEDVWRDVLVIAYDHALDTNTVTDSSLYAIHELLTTVFPDSTFDINDQRKALYTSTQRSTLDTIAAACPYEYGPGVYMARMMLSVADTTIYDYLNNCEKVPIPSGKRGEEEPAEPDLTNGDESEYAFNLYPNPNVGEFIIDLNISETDVAKISIWSVSGQMIDQRALNSGRQTIRVSASQGLYLYMVQVNGEPKWNGKIAISSDQ